MFEEDFINHALAERIYLTLPGSFNDKKSALACIQEVFQGITDELKSGRNVNIPGFGDFRIQTRKGVSRYNPKTGVPEEYPNRTYVSFKCGSKLKKRMNQATETKKDYRFDNADRRHLGE